jgi:Xaa-Pro aminopeptidase
MTRTFVAGKATARQREIYGIVLRAQETGKVLVQSGMRACDVDAVVRKIIGDAGYGKCFGHGTGHGVGRRVHERPRLSRNDNSILQINTVVTVEPGIYDPAFGGVRIEDMVAVTAYGCNVMTLAPRALMEVAG